MASQLSPPRPPLLRIKMSSLILMVLILAVSAAKYHPSRHYPRGTTFRHLIGSRTLGRRHHPRRFTSGAGGTLHAMKAQTSVQNCSCASTSPYDQPGDLVRALNKKICEVEQKLTRADQTGKKNSASLKHQLGTLMNSVETLRHKFLRMETWVNRLAEFYIK